MPRRLHSIQQPLALHTHTHTHMTQKTFNNRLHTHGRTLNQTSLAPTRSQRQQPCALRLHFPARLWAASIASSGKNTPASSQLCDCDVGRRVRWTTGLMLFSTAVPGRMPRYCWKLGERAAATSAGTLLVPAPQDDLLDAMVRAERGG